jgi:CRP-like cAMP-binding protein
MAATSEDTTRLLQRVALFSALAPEDLAALGEVAVPRRFEAGEVVFREGDAGDTCYVIESGQARAVRENADGRTITLAHFGPGDMFGELAMFDDERRSATVETLAETETVAILGADMRRLLREHPEFAMKMIIALGRKLRQTNERLAQQSFQTVQSRVAGVLLKLVQDARVEDGPGTGDAVRSGVLDGGDSFGADTLITATQADLAQLAGSSRESASRFLAVLERAGIITQGRGRLTVHDPAALERYVY